MSHATFDTKTLDRFRRHCLALRRSATPDRLDRRDYAPGDDYRRVDWRLCGRRDDLLTRIDVHRNVPAYVLLDCSRSMAIGEPAKFRLASVVAAMIAYHGLNNSRSSRVSTFAGRLMAESPTVCGVSRIGFVLRFLETVSFDNPDTDLVNAAVRFAERRQPVGDVTVITDCQDRASYLKCLRTLAARGHRPRLVQVYAPSEADPKLLGDVELLDVETGHRRQVVVTERIAARYREAFIRFLDSVRTDCRRQGFACLQVASDTPEADVLREALRPEHF